MKFRISKKYKLFCYIEIFKNLQKLKFLKNYGLPITPICGISNATLCRMHSYTELNFDEIKQIFQNYTLAIKISKNIHFEISKKLLS